MPKVSQINPRFRMPKSMEVVQHQLFKIYNATARKSSSDSVVNGCMFMEPETEFKKKQFNHYKANLFGQQKKQLLSSLENLLTQTEKRR